ncbi:class I SAM-dependent methyltransferase [Curtobacterium sp. MCPF17_002]|uniref:class I SAM-dependent methyltransferase n=1 Tax=Curtobacterium sp. MCPF17_002 TaxID=2175645 RepID=UPI000DAAB1E6|nr:class I SAM-dependent methyltransferase [Curtobacterium sp. MCPF17_002]WIB76755.1 class I SAM-dependent methyltransferase [Curtobacterium sp. MCPF17_002]
MAWMLAVLDRSNARRPWSHNQAYTPVVLAQGRRARAAARAGREPSRALDVGCGTGVLARRLGREFDEVVGLEPSAPTAALARQTTADTPSVRIVEGSLNAVGDEQFDLVSLVAVLHHLPLEPALRRLRHLVRPSGRLVVIGVAAETRRDLGWSVLSTLVNPIVGALRHPRARRGDQPPPHMRSPTVPATATFEEIRAVVARYLPGARMRRSLFWRYVLVWEAVPV